MEKKNSHHKVMAHSYVFYFVLFLLGIFMDLVFPMKIFKHDSLISVGVVVLVLATILILWEQKTARKLSKENINKESFLHGPYRYTSSPAHLGLFLLMFGFGMIVNGFFIMLFSVISFVISKFSFIKKTEKMLVEKYGEHYAEYKKSVKF
ncbi:MAG: DUF1295 domain-containing protein [Patescibacteria group bacterium]